MKKLLLLFFSYSFFSSFSQNLVSNSSFEYFSGCPLGMQCKIDSAIGWSSFSYSPDYFHACASTVPQNSIGYQNAATGNGYAGLFCYGNLSNAREYIGQKLISPLIAGKSYTVSFKTSLSESYEANCYINRLGVLFSTTSYSLAPCSHNPFLLPPNYAHIYSTDFLSDTANWVVIENSFIADSAYQYLIIGNFFDDNNTIYFIIDTTKVCDAYYFVDDISVIADTADKIDEYDLMNQIRVVPNPADNAIKITGELGNEYSLSIFDITGNLLAFNFNNKTIDTKAISNGIYFLKIVSNSYTVIKKVVITH